MKRFKNYLVALGAFAMMASCYPGGPSYVEDYDITFATKTNDADFSNKSENSYVLPDSIIDITDPDQVGSIPEINPAFEAKILSKVRDNMANYGYDERPDNHRDTVDYAVFVQRLISNNWVTYYWGGGGWCGWYPYYCGGYYPPTGSIYNYQTGTLYVTMIDINKSDTAAGVPYFVWDAGINGLLSSTQSNTETRALNGVDKMFELSPYLNKN